MDRTDYEQIVFGIISHAGEARGYAFEALESADEGDFEKSEQLMQKAEEELLEAHKIQTDIIQREAAEEKFDITVLFVHCQDHLMNTLTEKTLIEGMIKLHKKIASMQ